jgi:hypothetical protein
LRIFEGKGAEKNDVTFSYNANFFLFATLEMARPMAHGRMQPSSTTIPVLTGMPVSGMAYLDRPTEAGYFIFPDLSVRHEGKYKLSFNLYEETKLEGDSDLVQNDPKQKVPSAGAPDSSFDWRMEVKSDVFTVFSAKKFPGLAESTALSRTVAEQGCRVRIRRDVRMRRRGDNKGGDYDDAAEDEYSRAGRDQIPVDPYGVRSRSNSSDAGDRQPYHEDRRMSGDFSSQPYRPASYLDFGNSSNGQYQAPAHHFATPAPPAPPSHQPATQYHAGPSFRPAPHPASAQYGFERHPQSAYPTNPPREHEFEPEPRRASVAGSYAPAGAFPSLDTSFRQPGYQGYPPLRAQSPPQSVHTLPPLKPLESKLNGHSSPLTPISHVVAAPLQSPTYERNGSYGQYPTALLPQSEAARPAGKRSFEDSFPQSTARQNQPLFGGRRPSLMESKDPDNDEEDLEEPPNMVYKRADGSNQQRPIPYVTSDEQ